MTSIIIGSSVIIALLAIDKLEIPPILFDMIVVSRSAYEEVIV